MGFCGDVSCLCILVGREKSIGRKYKIITIAQLDNRLQNSSFVNQTQSAILQYNSQSHTPVLLGLTAGWMAGSHTRTNTHTYTNESDFKKPGVCRPAAGRCAPGLKITVDSNVRVFALNNVAA